MERPGRRAAHRVHSDGVCWEESLFFGLLRLMSLLGLTGSFGHRQPNVLATLPMAKSKAEKELEKTQKQLKNLRKSNKEDQQMAVAERVMRNATLAKTGGRGLGIISARSIPFMRKKFLGFLTPNLIAGGVGLGVDVAFVEVDENPLAAGGVGFLRGHGAVGWTDLVDQVITLVKAAFEEDE